MIYQRGRGEAGSSTAEKVDLLSSAAASNLKRGKAQVRTSKKSRKILQNLILKHHRCVINGIFGLDRIFLKKENFKYGQLLGY